MPVVKGAVWLVLGDQLPLEPPGDNATHREKQDHEHTRIFLAEIQLRYPTGAPENLVDASIVAVNRHQTITTPLVRQEITGIETQLGLPSTEPAVDASAPAVRLFLERLAARRGAYTWVPGPSRAFTTWVHGPSPLEYPLSITARINCWEAVLVAAAESGLIPFGSIRGAYAAQDVADYVFYLLTRTGTTEVTHANDTPGANTINAGDVVLIAGADGPLHHVVAVIEPDQDEYRNAQVMSLWDGVTTNILAQTTLGRVLPRRTTFWYASLAGTAVTFST